MYFPKLPATGQDAAKIQSPPDTTAQPVASRTKRLVYPGPQEIISDPPLPTNEIQTLLQPDLEDAPLLKPPLALPNLVLTPNAGLAEAPSLPENTIPFQRNPEPRTAEETKPTVPVNPVVEPEPLPVIGVPVLPVHLPLSRTYSSEFMVSRPPAQPVAYLKDATVEVPGEEGLPVELAPVPGGALQSASVLALSPIAAMPKEQVQLPGGEARGAFAISPQSNLDSGEIDASSTVGPPSLSTAPGGAPSNPPAAVMISFGSDAKATPSATSGSGAKAFAGITISGTTGSATASSGPALVVGRPLQTSYGISVISTESSGGGLPSFGVFENEQIYTVYLDMRQTERDSAPTWTLEFAVLREAGTPASFTTNLDESRKGLVLPFPVVKQAPVLPADVAGRYSGRMIVVYAIINTAGEIEQMTIKDSPDPLLNAPVLEALHHWKFRPAVLEGNPVAMKALFGIPVWNSVTGGTPPS